MNRIENHLANELITTEQEIQLEIFKTDLKRNKFISEIKNGLGNEIKSNANKKFIKKPFNLKVKDFFKKFFTKL